MFAINKLNPTHTWSCMRTMRGDTTNTVRLSNRAAARGSILELVLGDQYGPEKGERVLRLGLRFKAMSCSNPNPNPNANHDFNPVTLETERFSSS